MMLPAGCSGGGAMGAIVVENLSKVYRSHRKEAGLRGSFVSLFRRETRESSCRRRRTSGDANGGMLWPGVGGGHRGRD